MSKAISYLYFNNIEHEDLYGTQTDAPCYPLFTTSFTARLLENCLCLVSLPHIYCASWKL